MNQKVAKKIVIKKQRCRVAFFEFVFLKVARFKFSCFKQIHAKKFSSTLR